MQQAVQNSSSPLERNITVSVPIEQIEAEIAARLKQLARTVKMQGFRPGTCRSRWSSATTASRCARKW